MAAILFLAVVLLSLPQAALLPLLDRDEPRFAEAAREMLQSGNYIVPTFNGVPRYDKPPLTYWCEAAAYCVFGENALAARLPSLLATAATAVLIYAWGVKLGHGQAGPGAGLSYAFCVQTIQQGRVATADALLIFFMTLTAFAGWMLLRPRERDGIPVACYAALTVGIAGGFLAKGPEALLPLVPMLWMGREKRIGVTLSLGAGLALLSLWAIPAYVETHGAYWFRGLKAGIGDRAVVGLQSHGATTLVGYILTLPYYVVLFWVSALPWSILILARARKLFRNWNTDETGRYLIANAALVFGVFTLMATKLPHYTLPAFPLLALLFTRRWAGVELSPAVPIRVAAGFGIVMALVTLVAIPIAFSRHLSPSPAGVLVREAAANLTPDTPFALVDFKEPTAIWEMRRVTQTYADFIPETGVSAYLNRAGPHAVILSTSLWKKISGASDADWKIFEARGFNAAKGKRLDLTLIVKP